VVSDGDSAGGRWCWAAGYGAMATRACWLGSRPFGPNLGLVGPGRSALLRLGAARHLLLVRPPRLRALGVAALVGLSGTLRHLGVAARGVRAALATRWTVLGGRRCSLRWMCAVPQRPTPWWHLRRLRLGSAPLRRPVPLWAWLPPTWRAGRAAGGLRCQS
jgi:hypothetical protein